MFCKNYMPTTVRYSEANSSVSVLRLWNSYKPSVSFSSVEFNVIDRLLFNLLWWSVSHSVPIYLLIGCRSVTKTGDEMNKYRSLLCLWSLIIHSQFVQWLVAGVAELFVNIGNNLSFGITIYFVNYFDELIISSRIISKPSYLISLTSATRLRLKKKTKYSY